MYNIRAANWSCGLALTLFSPTVHLSVSHYIQMHSHETSLLCTCVNMLALDLLIINFIKLPVDGYPKNRESILLSLQ